VPGGALGLQEIEILQRGSRDESAVDRMECDALLERVRSRLVLERLRQLILCMPERMQLRRLLAEQHHKGEKYAVQRASSPIMEKRHGRILAELDLLRYLRIPSLARTAKVADNRLGNHASTGFACNSGLRSIVGSSLAPINEHHFPGR
jgi:hypothetical protein